MGAPARQPADRWALPSGRGASEVAHEAVSDLLNGRDDEPKSHDRETGHKTAAANGDSKGKMREDLVVTAYERHHYRRCL